MDPHDTTMALRWSVTAKLHARIDEMHKEALVAQERFEEMVRRYEDSRGLLVDRLKTVLGCSIDTMAAELATQEREVDTARRLCEYPRRACRSGVAWHAAYSAAY